MALEGIINENEFYSQHYLDEIFPGEAVAILNELKKKSAEGGGEDETASRLKQLKTAGTFFRKELEKALETAEAVEKLYSRHKPTKKREESEINIILNILKSLGLPVGLPGSLPRFALADELGLPLLCDINRPNGEPYLWVLHATPNEADYLEILKNLDDDFDPLEFHLSENQKSYWKGEKTTRQKELEKLSWLELLNKSVFSMSHSPKWVILASATQWVLIDRVKLPQRRILRFKWKTIFNRSDDKTFNAVNVLLGKEAFEEAGGFSILDKIDENSFKHACGVSKDLKYALRESIELLGNEAASKLRLQNVKGISADALSDECLRFMYRLLFLFYVESRPELQYAPLKDENYMEGYSLESLRDLELVPLETPEDREGHFFHESIKKLFSFYTRGTEALIEEKKGKMDFGNPDAKDDIFEIVSLKSSLFDENKMKLLSKVSFSNATLQRVIQLMSLSREASGNKSARGRISYAQLGLNQLGEVYEALLSYKGFFAKDDLYEVKKAEDKTVDILGPAYFVGAKELSQYKEEERVWVIDPLTGLKTQKVYPKDTFVYRMAGREKEESASYYTPEILTRTLVREALDVLIQQQLENLSSDKEKAEKILSWKICEPAMGSAAFLNEAINQISDLYMSHAMKVPGAEQLSQEKYSEERQKVKMFLADRNIYGVDLNPVAVELGQISIWLNSLSSDHYVPWFGTQFATGNSLVGCRREAFYAEDLMTKPLLGNEKKGGQYTGLKPHKVGNRKLNPNEIWHFLILSPEMSCYEDRVIKKLYPEQITKIKKWQAGLYKDYGKEEIAMLVLLSQQIDRLWFGHRDDLVGLDKVTTDPYSIYGRQEPVGDEEKKVLSYEQKEEKLDEMISDDGEFCSDSYARLKSVMDYWCSLWFWPIEEVDKLPSREEFIKQVGALCQGAVTQVIQLEDKMFESIQGSLFPTGEQLSLLGRSDLQDTSEEIQRIQNDPNLSRRKKEFAKKYPAIGISYKIADRQRFLHWDLQFADVFLPEEQGKSGGFDLMLCNPPWKVVNWTSANSLSVYCPLYSIRKDDYKAHRIDQITLGNEKESNGQTLFEKDPEIKKGWTADFISTAGLQSYFKSQLNYPEIGSGNIDLSKYFLPKAWNLTTEKGVDGLLHPENVYRETNGGWLRQSLYPRLRKHYHFVNELLLFPDINSRVEFSINVYGSVRKKIEFESVSSIYHPATIIANRQNQSPNFLPSTKIGKKHNIEGDKSRIVDYDAEKLSVTSQIFGGSELGPILPTLFVGTGLNIVQTISNHSVKLGSLCPYATITPMWHESGAVKDGIIAPFENNSTKFPRHQKDLILNAPHLWVGSPLYKLPRNPCTSNIQWDCIDLDLVSDDYLPRTKFYIASKPNYESEMPRVAWPVGTKKGTRDAVIKYYRLAIREFVGPTNERTLIAGIIPKEVSHVNPIETICFEDQENLLLAAASFFALPTDYYARLFNKSHMLPGLLHSLPFPLIDDNLKQWLRLRVLVLSCLTSYYAGLWDSCWVEDFNCQQWASKQPQVNQQFFKELTRLWCRDNALRSDLSRRQALLEIDVIVAKSFGMKLEELLWIYINGFTTMKKYEETNLYDQKGQLVFTISSGLKGVGLPKKSEKDDPVKYFIDGREVMGIFDFEQVRNKTEGTVSKTYISNDISPDGPVEITKTYVAPFFKMDRIKDYKEAWDFFTKLQNQDIDKLEN